MRIASLQSIPHKSTCAIMNAAEEWLRARGIAKLQLMVRKENTKVHAFYQSIGYYNQETVTFAKWLDGREPTP